MLKDIIISRQLENLEIYKDLYGKPFKRDLLAKVVFLITNPSYFRRPLQSLLLKIHRLPYFNMLFQHFFKSELFWGFKYPIILLSRSLVFSSRVLFLASPHWALGKPVEEVVLLEKGKYLPS